MQLPAATHTTARNARLARASIQNAAAPIIGRIGAKMVADGARVSHDAKE